MVFGYAVFGTLLLISIYAAFSGKLWGVILATLLVVGPALWMGMRDRKEREKALVTIELGDRDGRKT